MRNMVRILTVGALVGCLSGGLAYADGATGPTFKVTATEKAGVAGGEVTVKVSLDDFNDVGALQFMVKATGGTQGTLSVTDIVIDKYGQNFVFGPSDLVAVDKTGQMRAGAVKMDGGASAQTAVVATVTLQFSKNAKGTFQVNVLRNHETFLRSSSAAPIEFLIGEDVSFTVRDSATPIKRKRSGR